MRGEFCSLCLQRDIHLLALRHENAHVETVRDEIFKLGCVQSGADDVRVCRLCRQELDRLVKFVELCQQTSRTLRFTNEYAENVPESDVDVTMVDHSYGDHSYTSTASDKKKLDEVEGERSGKGMRNLKKEKYNETLCIADDTDGVPAVGRTEEVSTTNVEPNSNIVREVKPEEVLLNPTELGLEYKWNRQKITCRLCSSSFVQRRYYEEHLVMHSKEESFVFKPKTLKAVKLEQLYVQCPICKKPFPTRTKMMSHTRVHKGERPAESRHVCEVCGKSFCFPELLRRHRRVHQDVTRFVCLVCRRGFTSKQNLDRHQSTHSGEKPYRCDTCDRRYSTKEYLKQHAVVHTPDRPYCCDLCGMTFRMKQVLHKHVKRHKYSCDECPQSVPSLHALNGHVQTVLQCFVCDKEFLSRALFAEHQNTHTGKKPFVCGTCGERYEYLKSLRRHLHTH